MKDSRRAPTSSILEAFRALRSRHDLQDTRVHLHVGPANSGKTFQSIETLKQSGSGAYLAPLRLLAWEIADKLNGQGHPCSLVTGEEKQIVPGAPYVSSTVEMFNPDFDGDCIVLDESQMIADEQRGWAWMRVLALARVKNIEIIASPDAERLLTTLLHRIGYTHVVTTHHERLQPLHVAEKPWRLDAPLPHTVYVVFSRAGVLSLKTFLERRGHTVSAIYGNLPPEVKKRQAERFISGEAELCVATDAIGMGMNLPAAHVCFTDISKYDGQEQRLLLPSEARQIAGRAGRFGLKERGEAGALTHEHLKVLQKLLATALPPLIHARVTPEAGELERMEGPLAHRLNLWEKRLDIPEELRDVVLPANLEQQKLLAGFLGEPEVKKLGMETAFTLIKCPAGRDTIGYWALCVRHILEGRELPPPVALEQARILTENSLLKAETLVEQCDIYCWIGNREGFGSYSPEMEKVKEAKWSLIEKIDHALAARHDMRQRCRKCSATLPVLYSFGVCENCFRRGRRSFFQKPKHKKLRPPRGH